MPGKSTRRIGLRLAQATCLLLVTYVLSAIVITYAQNRALQGTVIGTPEISARTSFWFTPAVETAAASEPGPGKNFTTAGTRCTAPCIRRLWWIHPLLPDMEAWSVDLDNNGRVSKSYHWTSP
jgi:hypothetical protein